MGHDIEKEPLPFFLRQAHLQKNSGYLLVTARDFHISLNLLDGKLVNGMSTRFDEKLSVILHLMGRINEEQYNFLSGLHQFSDDQVTGVLFDHHFAKKKDIYYARIYQLRRIAISTFSLQRGQWAFTAGEPDPPLRETFEIPLDGILVEGARAVDHISVYANKWQSCLPVLFNEIPLANEIYFTGQERDFYAALQRQGRHSCRELIARLNMLPIDFWRSILAFHLLGLIEFEKGAGLPDLALEIAALLELNRKMQESAGAFPGLLGLPPDADADGIEKAKTKLLARFAPERFGSAAAPAIKEIARSVCQRLQKIAAELKMAAESSAEPELLSAAELLVEPETSAQANVMPDWQLDFELQAKAEMAPKSVAEKELPLEPLYRKFVPAANLAEGTHEKAWDFLLKSKELYEQREYAKAVDLMKVAIKLEPGQSDFHYLLGLCQSELAVMHNEAETHLKKAVELKSWSADPVYALGVLYRGQGKIKLAERCFQRVKEIVHEHSGASRALVDLRRQQPGKKNKVAFLKKKIF